MKPPFHLALILFLLVIGASNAGAQIDDICSEVGASPGLDSPFAHVPYVYGRVAVRGYAATSKPPKVTVILVDSGQSPDRQLLSGSGNYCFRRKSTAGTIVVEVNGIEAARRTLTSFGGSQQREDFEIDLAQSKDPPSVVSAKFSYPRNEKTVDLYKKTLDAEALKDTAGAISNLQEIVAIDANDFIAWAKLGSLYFEQKKYTEADAAFRKSLELKVDYTPAWIAVGQLRVAQKQYEAAAGIFKHAAELEPSSARAYQLLGESYLLARQGTLGAEALNQAIKLDPVGMAECHLQLAHLYELAGAKSLATKEYKVFLAVVPDHPDKKKFEKFIKENPE